MRTLEITTYIGCPNDCWYCPQAKLVDAYRGNKEMSVAQFRQILANTPKDVRIDFTGFSEVFCHEEGAKFMLLAFQAGFQVVVYTTLVGFQTKDIPVLKGIRFNEVVFHQYPGYDQRWFDNKREQFEHNIQPGRVAVITDANRWTRAGNVSPTEKQSGPFHCLFAGKDFDHNVVLPNGDVYLCCQDYSLKHRLGNLYEQNYNDMFRAKIKVLSNSEDSECICRHCEIMQHD